MSKIGIVGSNGFIGKNLKNYLEASGHEVFAYTRKNSIVGIEKKLMIPPSGLDLIVWAASRVNPISASNDENVEIEYQEWANFLELWEELDAHNSSIVYLSSGGCVYTDENYPFTEESIALGTNAYGRLKIRMEDSLISSKVNGAVLRLSNVYGQGQKTGSGQGVIAEWKYKLESKMNIPIYGSTQSFRDYIHIQDVTEAISLFLQKPIQKGIYNLGSGQPTTLGELIELFKKLVGSEQNFEILEKRPTDRNGYFLDITKLTSNIDWNPKINLQNGLELTLGNLIAYDQK